MGGANGGDIEAHKYLDIVLGTEPKPIATDDDGTPVGPNLYSIPEYLGSFNLPPYREFGRIAGGYKG